MEWFEFSSGNLPHAESIDATRDVYRQLAQIELEPVGGTFFSDLSVRVLPGLAIARIDTSACIARRASHNVADGNDDLIVQILTNGRSITSKTDSDVMCLTAGEAYLAPNECTGQSIYDMGAQGLSIAIPRAVLAPRLADRHLGQIAKLAPSPELRLLARYASAIMDEADALPLNAGRIVATHLHDLAALALGATRDAARHAKDKGVRAARLQAITIDIEANLSNPSLSLDWLALRHGISPRYLRALFYGARTSFSDFVRNARLERAKRLLSDPRFSHLTISAIAFEVGFGDLSWFNQVFRRRFGATPSDVRATAAGRDR
ncbi:helix-turn-helix transcriptional regulator [Roseinatronobacter alkalisoli]|uniref:Helix-turn-helix transcriptional regulator n=1 Tax=Roseinatronobacter alkalisoli TaxID=3028235 RepID=A0ABT5T7X0_9RHOB|nr:AraC family transcriptional regulator [Roseinatronobacter sp. HJB301]MDD7971076.1 helix-turn-helix transcriptional regulator [Roseinatronobacter sp. HJB301]